MADGKTHQRFAIAGTVAVAALTIPHDEIAYTIGAAVAVVLDPDLDLYQVKTQSESTMEKLLPEPLFRVWFAWTTAYGTLFPHRSFWTHTPGLGTAIRFAWMLGPLVLLGLPAAWLWGPGLLKAWAGATFIDGIHWVLDTVKFKGGIIRMIWNVMIKLALILLVVTVVRTLIGDSQINSYNSRYETRVECTPILSHDMTRIVGESCR